MNYKVFRLDEGEITHIIAPTNYTAEEVIEWYNEEYGVEFDTCDTITLCTEKDLDFFIKDTDGDFGWEDGKIHAKDFIKEYVSTEFSIPEFMCSTVY